MKNALSLEILGVANVFCRSNNIVTCYYSSDKAFWSVEYYHSLLYDSHVCYLYFVAKIVYRILKVWFLLQKVIGQFVPWLIPVFGFDNFSDAAFCSVLCKPAESYNINNICCLDLKVSNIVVKIYVPFLWPTFE